LVLDDVVLDGVGFGLDEDAGGARPIAPHRVVSDAVRVAAGEVAGPTLRREPCSLVI
jgi:hypothetical protein